jgi:tRNA-specific adenosine deaminase 1
MATIVQQRQQPSSSVASSSAADAIVSATLSQYSSLPFTPQPGKHTVLASFALHDPDAGRVRLLSLGAGVKCLPAHRLPVRGDALHDSHAEVIARRGAIRWLLEEVQRDVARTQGREQAPNEEELKSTGAEAAWVCARADGLYTLRDNVHLWMYASTVPCTSHPFPFPMQTFLSP